MNFLFSLLAIVISLFSVLNTPKQELGVATILPVQQGGLGTTTLSANSAILGNGTSSLFASSSPSFGALYSTTTATSTLFRGVNIEGGCFSILGICVANSSGITSLNGLTGASQTFSAQGPLLIGSAGTIHTFIASSSPSFGEVRASTTLAVATTTLGTFILGIHGDALIAGSTTVKGLLATSSIESPQLRVSGAATSTFVGGITSAGTGNFTGGLMLGNALNNTGSATSSFSGGLSVASLASSGGLTLTGGSISALPYTGLFNIIGIGTATPSQILGAHGDALIAGTTTVKGIFATSTIETLSLKTYGTATNTFAGGIQFTGSANICTTGGICLGASGGGGGITSLNGLSGASQTFGVQGPLLIGSAGTIHTFIASSSPSFGDVRASTTLSVATTTLASQFTFGVQGSSILTGTTTVGTWYSTSSTIYLGSSVVPFSYPTSKMASGTILLANGDGAGTFQAFPDNMELLAMVLPSAATTSMNGQTTGTTGTPNLPARRHYRVICSLVGLSGASFPQVKFNGDGTGNYGNRDSINNAVDVSASSNTQIDIIGGTNGNDQWFEMDVYVPASGTRKRVTYTGGRAGTGAGATDYVTGSGIWNNTTDLITDIACRAQGGFTFTTGSQLLIYGSKW